MDEEELIESIAAVQHAIWSHWMRYMFTCGQFDPDGTWHMPAFKAERWQRQMDTPYNELTDGERESDRDQARKVIALGDVRKALADANQRAEVAEAKLARRQQAEQRMGDWLERELNSDEEAQP